MRNRIVAIVVAAAAIIAAATLFVWSPQADDHVWDLSRLEENWDVPADSWVMEAIDPHGPRYQVVDLPHPGWLVPPAERAGSAFPQVIVSGVVDLREGVIVPHLPNEER